MIPYHGGPITPDTAAVEAYTQGHAFISWRRPDQLILAAEVCRSFALDNGAFTAWRSGHPVTDWSGYYVWAAGCALYPNCDFAVMPDVIDGSEQENDALLDEWPLPIWLGAPVWHMHEGIADTLLQEFGGAQTLVAFHHGVVIKTIRPHIAHWSRPSADPLADSAREDREWADFAEGRTG